MRHITPRVLQLAAVAGSLWIGASCFGQATTNPDAASAKRDIDVNQVRPGPERAGWWNDAVFYHMFVRSFKDSDVGPLAGDGVGDIRGIIDQLDYLNDGNPNTDTDLGVTGLWLMPVHPSPGYHGYEVADFYGINPQYGTMEDFRELIRECDKRGIRVILDLVLNHISYTHPWFVEASKDPKSPKRDWFIWSDKVPEWKGPWNQSVWWPAGARPGDQPPAPGAGPDNDPATKDASYYYSIFYLTMPDVNYRNKGASDAMLEAVKYWIEKEGVAGYRLDAIRHLVEDGPLQENTPATHEWLRLFHKTYKAARADAFTVGEVWTDSATCATYIGDQLDTCFEFDLSYAMMDAARDQNPARVRDAQRKVVAVYPPGQYGRFLTNHDQARVMTTLGGNVGAARSAACMLLLGPGVPFVYYGEELGMMGDKPDQFIRTPMRWNTLSNAGFTQGTPWIAVGDDARTRNVQVERSDDRSLFNLYRRLIHLRNGHESLMRGQYQPLTASDLKTYAYLRVSHDEKGAVKEVAIVAINLGDTDASDVRVGAFAQAPETALDGASWSGELVWAGQGKTADAMATYDVPNMASGLAIGDVPAHDAVVWILKKK